MPIPEKNLQGKGAAQRGRVSGSQTQFRPKTDNSQGEKIREIYSFVLPEYFDGPQFLTIARISPAAITRGSEAGKTPFVTEGGHCAKIHKFLTTP
jgi:hypothetical protein